MLTQDIKKTIDNARDVLVGKIPNPQAQIEQITAAMIYKFMDDMDKKSVEFGGTREYFADELEKYAWTKIMSKQLGNDKRMTLYTEALDKLQISARIPQLFRKIFKGAYLPFRDGQTLTLFLKEINDLTYNNSENLGNGCEYLLSIMGAQGDAGQFRTPRHIIDFIVDAVKPSKKDTILDPACGTAGFLISAYKYILKTAKETNKPLTPQEKQALTENIQGYDISPDMVKLALVNLYLHKFKEPKIYEYDTLTHFSKWDEYFDCIFANPPFMTPKGGIQPHNKFGIKAKRSEVLFVDYIMEHLNKKGRAGVIVPDGIVFQSANVYKELRKKLVDDNYLYAAISLPKGIFQPYSGVKTSILFMDRKLAAKTDKILFVEIKNDGYTLGAQRKRIEGSDLPKAVETMNQWQEAIKNKTEFKPDYPDAVIADKSKIAENGEYNLTYSMYKENFVYIPNADNFIRLGDICEFKRGETITKKEIQAGKIPVIAGGRTPCYYHNKSNREGEIITIAASGAAGYISWHDMPVFVSDAFSVKSNDETKCLTKYVYYVLKAKQEYIYSLRSGAGIPHLYIKNLIDFKIPLPCIEMQKKIVKELDGYQSVIDGAQKVIDSWLPDFPVNPKWEKVKLNNDKYFKIQSGGTPAASNPDYWNGNINWVTLEDLPAEDFITTLAATKRKITKAGLEKSAAKLLPVNTVMVSSRATIGRVAVNTKETASNQGFKNIVIKDFSKVNVKFLAVNLKYLADKIKDMASGGIFKEISASKIGNLEVYMPSIKEQNAVVSRIEDDEKALLECKNLIKRTKSKMDAKFLEVWNV